MSAVDPITVEVGSAPITVTVATTGLVLSIASGTVGPAGAQGPAGSNGTNGQGVPVGGTTGQVLSKASGANYDTTWTTVSGGGGGGSGTVTSVTGTAPISVASGTTTPVVSIAAASTSAAGSMSSSDKTKLDGVASGATANATDAQLRDRSTHTGTQTLSTISDAGTAAAKNAPAAGNAAAGEVVLGSDSRLADARTPSAHAASHAAAGSDPLTLAQSQVTNLATDLAGKVPTSRTVNGKALSSDVTLTASDLSLATIATSGSASNLTAGTVPTARLGSGTADATTFLRGDQSYAVPTGKATVVGGQGAGSQVNEPSVATSLLTSTVTIPVCAAGDVLLFSAGINFTQNSSVSRSVTFAVKLGATTILSSIPSVTSSATARVMHLQGAIRVGSTTAQSASMILSFSTSASGSTGVVNAATGTATENLASASTLDLLVTATNNATQNYTLQYLNVTKVAA